MPRERELHDKEVENAQSFKQNLYSAPLNEHQTAIGRARAQPSFLRGHVISICFGNLRACCSCNFYFWPLLRLFSLHHGAEDADKICRSSHRTGRLHRNR